MKQNLLRSAAILSLFQLVQIVSVQAQPPAPTVLRDIPYLGPDRAEKMDAYLPPDRFQRPTPAVLLIHGGGWKQGDKADKRERNIGTELAAEGFAVFSINYELNRKERPDGTGKLVHLAWPQNLYDCKSALRYIRQNSGKFGIAPGEIAVMGGSAGGMFAMLLGTTAENAELNRGGLYTEESNAVKCIVDFYGVPDVTGKWSSAFIGPTKAETEKNALAASPCTYFSKSMPPILIAHGTADVVLDVQVSRDLSSHLKEMGVDCTYVEVPDAPHMFHLQPEQKDLRPEVLAFLRKHLGNTNPSAY